MAILSRLWWQRQPRPSAEVPIGGQIIWHDAVTAPEGYLPCNGSAVSRTTYADLFAVIGTTYGAGDGSTTFDLPISIVDAVGGGGYFSIIRAR